MDKIQIGRKNGKDITKHLDIIILTAIFILIIYARAEGTWNKKCVEITVTEHENLQILKANLGKQQIIQQYKIETGNEKEWQNIITTINQINNTRN